jgi:MFS family permease
VVTVVARFVERLDFGLPREVYVLQAGLVLNAFGNGAANPFVILYLHNVRDVALPIAGLAAATSAATALVASLVSGSLADRVGPRATMIGGLLLSAAGFAVYPFIAQAWQAFPAAVLTGAGIGTWLTGQSALLAAVTPPAVRAIAFAQQRVAANVGLGLGGFLGGLIVTTGDPSTFTVLFLLNAATFLVYIAFLVRLPTGAPRRVAGERPGSYGEVLRDQAFMRFALANFLWVAAAVALLNSLVPVFARNEGGIDEAAIGLLFLLNSLTIIALQIPTARLQEGRRRARGLAVMSVLFAVAWLTLGLSGVLLSPRAAFAGFAVAIFVLSLGECLYDSIQGPLTAELAGERLRGRYMAVNGFSWQLGFILGPAAGAALLTVDPLAVWIAAAAACLLGGGIALRLEQRLPDDARVTPARPRPVADPI